MAIGKQSWLDARIASRCCWALLVAAAPKSCSGADGQSFKASDEELERVFNDPNCERTRDESVGVRWDALREELHSVNFPQSMTSIGPVVKRLSTTAEMDREATICPFGVVAVLFFFTKYLIESETPNLDMARIYFSLLDGYASGAHPHLLDQADWLVKDSRLISLRHVILRRLPAVPGIGLGLDATSRKRPFVYVYGKETPEIAELTQGASFCSKGQWGMEVHMHEWLLASPHLVKDPDKADFFFVPGYSICMFEGGFLPVPILDDRYKSMVKGLPYFERNRGRDHVFTFGSGMSANVFRSWADVIPESIFLTPETWLFNDFPQIREPCFNTWKDVVIPGYLHKSEILSLTGAARPLAEREHLAVFLGRTDASRGPHPTEGSEPDVRGALRILHEEGKIVVAQNLSFPEMHALMGNARFCFVPKGKSAWSLRFFEALFANCVPVVLSDHWELPFEAFLDLPSFVIKWPMADVSNRLLAALRLQSDAAVESYMASSRAARCWYVYPPLLHDIHIDGGSDALRRLCPSIDTENAFAGIMEMLERKRRVSRTGGGRRFFGP